MRFIRTAIVFAMKERPRQVHIAPHNCRRHDSISKQVKMKNRTSGMISILSTLTSVTKTHSINAR